MKKKLTNLFKNLCCSRCKEDFTEESINIVREEDGMIVIRLICTNCGKSFGVAFVGVSDLEMKDESEPLVVQEGAPPITADDVIDAHEFIKNLDEHWSQYLP